MLTHSLIIYRELHSDSQGYMWLAARKIWLFLVVVFSIEAVIGAFFFFVSLSRIPLCPRILMAILAGIMVAAIPTALELALLPDDAKDPIGKLQKPLTKLLLKFNLMIRYEFATAISNRREQDVFDCQSKNAWGLDLSATEVGRRIRIVYELRKRDLARRRRDPEFLRYDTGRNPWEKFYLLVRLVGRKRLRHDIKNPPPAPCLGWNGSERRKTKGTPADRGGDAAANSKLRCYDDLSLMERIRAGKDE